MRTLLPALLLVTGLVIFMSCGDVPPIADPADEDGNAPTYVLHIQGPGLNINIKSQDACPGDGLTNPFGSRTVELPPDRTYTFIYTVSDIGGVPQTRIGSNDTTLLNFKVEVPEATRVSYSTSPGNPTKQAIISRGPELRTAVLASGELYPMRNGRTSLVVDGFDAASNNTFHTINFIIAEGSDAELRVSTCP